MLTSEERVRRLREQILAMESGSPMEPIIGVLTEFSEIKDNIPSVYVGPFITDLSAKLQWSVDRVEKLLSLTTVEEQRWALEYVAPPPEPRLPGEALYPTTGWIGRYLDWCIGDEAPLGFHFWSAMSALSGVCRRNIYLDMRRFTVWPNLYVVLVGDPGTKKGQAMLTALSVLSRVNYRLTLDNTFPEINRLRLLPEKATPESVLAMIKSQEYHYIDDFGEHFGNSESHGIWFVEELVMLLSSTAYNPNGTIEMLTAFFNCPEAPQVSTIGRGLERLFNVSMTFLGATTPGWWRTGVTQAMFQGGFMSRLNTVYREPANKHYFMPSPIDPIAREDLVEWLLPIMRWRGRRYHLSPEAQEWGSQWYEAERERLKHIMDENYKDFYARRQIQACKLGLLFAVSDSEPEISRAHFQKGVEILAMEERQASQVFRALAAHEDVELGDYVISVIRRKGGRLHHRDLLNLTKRRVGNSQSLMRVLTNLRTEGRVGLVAGNNNSRIWYSVKQQESPFGEDDIENA